jgi:hypothetical protein
VGPKLFEIDFANKTENGAGQQATFAAKVTARASAVMNGGGFGSKPPTAELCAKDPVFLAQILDLVGQTNADGTPNGAIPIDQAIRKQLGLKAELREVISGV